MTDTGPKTERQQGPLRMLLKGCAVAAGLFAAVTILSTGFGIVVGLYTALTADGGESLNPSQKARILAEGISAAMNCAAFVFLLLIPVAAIVGVWIWRRRKTGGAETGSVTVETSVVEATTARELHGTEAVKYATERLTKVKSDANGWTIDYVDDATGDVWVMDYPNSELHGGGSPRLRRKE